MMVLSVFTIERTEADELIADLRERGQHGNLIADLIVEAFDANRLEQSVNIAVQFRETLGMTVILPEPVLHTVYIA